MGSTEDDTAAGRLGALVTHFRQHRVTGPAGHSFVSSAPRATSDAPAAPVNLEVVDHITACLREISDHAHEVNPGAGPLPPRVQGAYSWYMENTRNAPEAEQQRRDTIVYKQSLEHAIAMGETKVVRPHRCPDCDTFSLMWSRPMQQIVCTNRKCTAADGTSRIVTPARIARHHIAAMSEKTVRDCAT
jgi:ribosomal protein L37AE/L43A